MRAQLRAFLNVPAHRKVGQQVHRQVLLLFEQPQKDAAQAPVDVPVDAAQVVARRVRPKVAELDALAQGLRALFGKASAARHARRDETQLAHRFEEVGVEQFRPGQLDHV